MQLWCTRVQSSNSSISSTRQLQDAKTRYKQVEKFALSPVVVAQGSRPYFQGHQVVVKIDHLVKILHKLDLEGRIVGWLVELFEFGLQFESRESVRR